jgi:hypothetical protein
VLGTIALVKDGVDAAIADTVNATWFEIDALTLRSSDALEDWVVAKTASASRDNRTSDTSTRLELDLIVSPFFFGGGDDIRKT